MSATVNAEAAIKAAIPNASDELISHIVWGRTPFPFKQLSAKDFYAAAFQWRRASERGIRLCEFCDRIAHGDEFTCSSCERALRPRP